MLNANWKVYLLLAFATSSWGTAFVAGKFATEVWHPYMVAFLRFFGASIFLYPYMRWKEHRPERIERKDWLMFALLGLSGCALYNIFFFTATQQASIIKSALVIAWNPILITILAAVFLKETITKAHMSGSIIATVGVIIIISKGSLEDLLALRFETMDAILLGAIICWAIYSVVGKVALTKFSPVVTTTYACLFGALFLLPFAVWTFEPASFQEATWVAWVSIIDIAILVSVIGFILYYQGIRQLGAAKASIFINFMPLSATLLSVWLLNEPLHPYLLIGGCFVLGGVYVSAEVFKIK